MTTAPPRRSCPEPGSVGRIDTSSRATERPARLGDVSPDRYGKTIERPEPLPLVDVRWRSVERGEHGHRAREAVAHLASAHDFTVVERDRRGGSTGLSADERRVIVDKMIDAVASESTVTRAARNMAVEVGRSERTVPDAWWASREDLSGEQRRADNDPCRLSRGNARSRVRWARFTV